MSEELPTTQHHVPRFLMRGFSTVGRKGRRYTFAYTKDKVFNPNLEGLGGERHFYTRPGENTIEFDLSDFEGAFAPFHQSLIDGEFDPAQDTRQAAELLAHASLRAKLLRFEMSVAFDEFQSFIVAFTKDKKAFTSLLREHLEQNPDLISADPRAKLLGGDFQWLDEVIRYNPELALQFIDPEFSSNIEATMRELLSNVDELSRSTHLKLLEETLAPEKLVDRFQSQNIGLVRLDTKTVVFGDSVVFYLDKKGNPIGGLNVAGRDSAICLPVSPNSLLISSPFSLDHEKVDYLKAAIRSSLSFFAYPAEQAHLKNALTQLALSQGINSKPSPEKSFPAICHLDVSSEP